MKSRSLRPIIEKTTRRHSITAELPRERPSPQVTWLYSIKKTYLSYRLNDGDRSWCSALQGRMIVLSSYPNVTEGESVGHSTVIILSTLRHDYLIFNLDMNLSS